MKQAQWRTETKFGTFYLVASPQGLQAVDIRKQAAPMVKSLKDKDPAVQILAESAKQLQEYMEGKRIDFDLPLDFAGTDFQKKVWKKLLGIPYGKTISYKELAKRVQNPKACRAVGSANGKNPICIIIPCHRVIAADGGLGGYSSGLPLKVKLLELEKAQM